MRRRERILDSLDALYREVFERAEREGDDGRMSELDFQFRRDQIWLEVLLDLREALREAPGAGEREDSLIDKARALRDLAPGRRR